MKLLRVFLICLLFSFSSSAQDMYQQLNQSVERTDGGAGAVVKYHVFLSPTVEKTFDATDWEKGEVKGGDNGRYFELTRKKDDETESMIINLDAVAYCELIVKTVKGKKEFHYNFFF